MFRILTFSSGLLLVGCTQFASGQVRDFNPDSLLQYVLDELEGTPLSLREATNESLQKSTTVRTAEAVYMAAMGASQREAGIFDPQLFFSLSRLEDKQPTASFFSGAPVLSTKQTNGSAGLSMYLPTGATISAALNTLRYESNSTFAFINPQYTAFGNLSIRQPLLGGFMASARKQAAKADNEMEAAKARYDQAVVSVSSAVEKLYWDLYAAERDYAVQKVTRDRAEAFLKETELRARVGMVGPNQVANARTFLAEQEILLLDREEHLGLLSEQLASAIGVRPEGTDSRFVTVDTPPEDFPLEDLDVLVEQAKNNSLVLQASQADIEARRSLASAAFWEMLPEVNLVGSIGGNGLAGVPQRVRVFGIDTIIAFDQRTLGDAIDQAVNREYPNWSIGVEVNIPILLRSGRGERDRLEAELIISEQRRINEVRLLEEQVRNTYHELTNGKKRLNAAREGVFAAQEQVRIGLIEFQNGRTTAFELVRLGADFAVAQQRYSQALVRGAKAAATLKQLTSGAYGGANPR